MGVRENKSIQSLEGRRGRPRISDSRKPGLLIELCVGHANPSDGSPTPTKSPPQQTQAPSLGSLGISLTAVRRRLVEKDECQGVAGLGHRVAALARDLAGHAAGIFRNHFAETVALNGHLLSRFDLVVELDQMLDESALRCDDRERTVADEDTHVLACAPHWPGQDAVMLEDVHCAFHEQRDHLEVQDACSSDLRREGRDAHIDERIVQDTGVDMIVEDLADGVELRHRLDLGHIHAGNIECGDIESGGPGMEVDRGVGVRPQQPVEQEAGVSAGRGGAVLVPGPFPVHVDQVIAPAEVGPSALHAFHGRAGHVRDRHHRARHLRRIELVHHCLDRMHGAHLVTMHTTDEHDALARLRSLGDSHRHIPVLSGGHLHALKVQKVLLARSQVFDIERADDLFPLDRIAGIDRS